MKRRYVGLAAGIGLLLLIVGVLWARRAAPPPVVVGQLTAVPTRPRPVYTPQPADNVAPIVVQRSPERGEELASDGVVQLVFDRQMDQGSVEAAFSIAPAVPGRLEWADERTVRFLPAQPLSRAAVYDVLLSQTAKASDGAALNSAYQFRMATAGYLEVAQSLPADGIAEVEADAVITIVFNRPVVALKIVEEQNTQPQPLQIDPPLAGAGEWLNTSIYVFKPDQPLPGGTTFTVSISDLKDLDGNPLEQPYRWSWTTVRPQVLFASPEQQAKLVSVEPTLAFTFNQPIDRTSAERSIELRSSSGTTVGGTVQISGETLIFTPTSRLEFDKQYDVVIAGGLQGSAGGAGMAAEYRSSFSTVPLPRIIGTRPGDGDQQAEPYTDFTIIFNAPIDQDTVMANLLMTPPLSPTTVYTYFDSYSNEFHLNFGVQPSTEYSVRLGPDIADPYGNLTGQTVDVRFKTAQLDPSAQLIVPGSIATYNAGNPARVAIRSVNLAQVNFELYRLPNASLQDSAYAWTQDLPAGAESLRRWTEPLQSPLNTSLISQVELVAAGGQLAPGAYLLVLNDGDDYPERHVLVVSTLNLTLKSAEREALVWANSLVDGQPVAGLAVEFFDNQGVALGSATTDASGIARLDLDRTSSNGVIALAREPFAAIAADWSSGVSAWDFGLEGAWDLPEMAAHIYTDRPIYRPDQQVDFKGLLRSEDDVRFSLPSGLAAVEVTITSPTGEQVFGERLPLSDLGTFAGSLKLGAGAALGSYTITAQAGENYFNASFEVAAYRAPEFEVTVAPQAAELVRGSASSATVSASYFFGGPVANVPVQWNVLAEDYSFSPDWAGRYQFSASDDPWRCWECWWQPSVPPTPLLSGSGTTNAQGQLVIDLPADLL
ncbi:MAG: Ig-like domain-containing protein, partial [Herpetosiphonaceae bacterium]|nr:Ig-like domain-containing protein [Herpetosiphonaceae bacterium]